MTNYNFISQENIKAQNTGSFGIIVHSKIIEKLGWKKGKELKIEEGNKKIVIEEKKNQIFY